MKILLGIFTLPVGNISRELSFPELGGRNTFVIGEETAEGLNIGKP